MGVFLCATSFLPPPREDTRISIFNLRYLGRLYAVILESSGNVEARREPPESTNNSNYALVKSTLPSQEHTPISHRDELKNFPREGLLFEHGRLRAGGAGRFGSVGEKHGKFGQVSLRAGVLWRIASASSGKLSTI